MWIGNGLSTFCGSAGGLVYIGRWRRDFHEDGGCYCPQGWMRQAGGWQCENDLNVCVTSFAVPKMQHHNLSNLCFVIRGIPRYASFLDFAASQNPVLHVMTVSTESRLATMMFVLAFSPALRLIRWMYLIGRCAQPCNSSHNV